MNMLVKLNKISVLTVKSFPALFLLAVLVLFGSTGEAQNIINDTVLVSMGAVVEIKFPDKTTSWSLPDGDKSYDIADGPRKKSFVVKSLRKDANPQWLIVSEGGSRRHAFVLVCTEAVPRQVIDWSNMKQLKAHVKEKEDAVAREMSKVDALSKQGALEEALPILARIINDVDESRKEKIKSRMTEIEQMLQVQKQGAYTNAMTVGNRFQIDRQYKEAWEAYQDALKQKPGDPEATKKSREVGQILFNDYVSKAVTANGARRYDEAKRYYEAARDIDAAVFQQKHKKKYDEIVRKATEQAFNKLKEEGNNAVIAKAWDSAKVAFEAALALRPGDASVTKQLDKVNAERVKRLDAQKLEADYYRILSKAKNMANAAKSEREYKLAIDEYNRASSLFPKRQFPKSRIDALQKKIEDASAKN